MNSTNKQYFYLFQTERAVFAIIFLYWIYIIIVPGRNAIILAITTPVIPYTLHNIIANGINEIVSNIEKYNCSRIFPIPLIKLTNMKEIVLIITKQPIIKDNLNGIFTLFPIHNK